LPILMIQRTIVVFSTQITSCFIMQTLFNSCKDQQMDCIRSVPKGKKMFANFRDVFCHSM